MTDSYEVVDRPDRASVVIRLTGQVDREASMALDDAYTRSRTWDRPTVVLDFSDVDYINSTGIALIVSLLGRARAERRQVHAAGLTEHYRHVFDITRLSDFIEVFADVDAAIHAEMGDHHD